MPARRFFAMLRAARKIQAYEYLELVDIQAISICDSKYYKAIHERYANRVEAIERRAEKPRIVYDEPETHARKTAHMAEQLALMRRLNFGR